MAQGSYGRRLLTPQNVILYLALAGLAYVLAVYFFARNTGGLNLPAGAPSTAPTTSNQLAISLNAQNNSGQDGRVIIQPINNGAQTRVIVETANPPGNLQPAHIHVGSCPSVGEIRYGLNDLSEGRSETILDVAYVSLRNMGPIAINVHKSAAEQNVYVSCGNLQF